jgi:DNA-binding LacI/PurR family transcriptional regulator
VARRAGVSIATVSRVVNGRGNVSETTAAAVQRALAETPFRPSNVGRSLATARSRTLGILVPSLKNPIFADAVHGMQMSAEAQGYGIILMSSEYDEERELRAVDRLLANRVDGLVLTLSDAGSSPAASMLQREPVPYVLVFNPRRRKGQSVVSIDHAAAAEAVVTRLIDLGHRGIGMVVGRLRSSDRSGLRRAGYERALARHHLALGPVIELGFDSDDLRAPLERALSLRRPPTAFFCSTDLFAIATIRALAHAGRRVPDEISVAGFDGVALGEWVTPSLATAVQPAETIGTEAVRHLIARIERQAAPAQILLPFSIRSGGSWAPPK